MSVEDISLLGDALDKYIGCTVLGPYCRECKKAIPPGARSIHDHLKKIHGEKVQEKFIAEVIRVKLKAIAGMPYDTAIDEFASSNPVKRWFCLNCKRYFHRKTHAVRHLRANKKLQCEKTTSGDGESINLLGVDKSKCCQETMANLHVFPTRCYRMAPRQAMVPNTNQNSIRFGNFLTEMGPTIQTNVVSDVSTLTLPTIFAPFKRSPPLPPELNLGPQQLVQRIQPYLRPNEDPVKIATMYQYILRKDDFEQRLLKYISCAADKSQLLTNNAVQAAKKWFETGRHNMAIQRLPGNIRCALASFAVTDNVSESGQLNFSPREGNTKLVNELVTLVRFILNLPAEEMSSSTSQRLQEFKSERLIGSAESLVDSHAIADLIHGLMMEEGSVSRDIPIIALYALSRGFVNRGGTLEMQECGWHASKMSALVHILRTCTASVIDAHAQSYEGTDQSELLQLASHSQKTATIQTICPWINLCRVMNRAKPATSLHMINLNGDITIDSWVFRYEASRRLIPAWISKVKTIFGEILADGEYLQFLNTDLPIVITEWDDISAEVRFATEDGVMIKSANVNLLETFGPGLQKLTAHIAFALWTLGSGGTRFQEILRLVTASTEIKTEGHLDYFTKSYKRGSRTASTAESVRHRLSCCVSRAFVLYRVVLKKADMVNGKRFSCDHTHFPHT